jgi:serine/threonine-protein kinase
MELVEGHSLVSRLADGILPIAEAASVMTQVCDALAAAHAAGVVHRDVKPGNILITHRGTVKVCDFGIARLQDTTALTASNVAIGTSSYMAPEQISGRPVDGRADLYAVGCVLFQMLTGTPPFTGESAFNVADQQVHAEPPALRSRRPEVHEDLDRLVGHLLAKDPGQRPETAARVRAELMRWKDSATVETQTLPVAPSTARRRYARAGIAAAVVIAVLALLLAALPEPRSTLPPAAVASSSPSVSASPATTPTPSPTAAVTSPAAVTEKVPSAQPTLSPSPPASSPLEQVMALKDLVQQLTDAGQLAAKNAEELDHLLNDLANLILQQKQREAQDKIAAIRKKNDGLLNDEKITAAGHDAIEARIVQLTAVIPASPGA